MKRNRFGKNMCLIFLLLILSTVFLQACSTSGKDATKKDKENTNGGVEEGGTLKVLVGADATSLDPHFITNVPTANFHYQKIYETLIAFDEEMEIIPKLAKDWKQVDDLTWEFYLQEGVSFHDGEAFNAEAVKVTFDRLLDPATSSPQRDKVSMINEVKAIDEYTVQLILDEPYAPILTILASQEASIMSPKSVLENPESLIDTPVGTGPFVFGSWESGNAITIVKNENYWGEPVKVDEVVFQVIPEDSTRIAMLETGEAHISDQVPSTELDRISNSENLNLMRTEGLAVEYIGFNMQKAPLDNKDLRLAISHAIEREAIITGIYNDVGTLANSTMSPNVFGYSSKIEPYPYDINKAKAHFEKSGVDPKTEISIVTSDRKERIDMAEVIESQLKGIGMNAKIQVLEYGAYIDTVNNGEHDIFIGGWGNATGDGDYNQYNLFHTDSFGAPGNHFYYSKPEVDQLIEQGRVEVDADKRLDIYEKVQLIEMEDAAYVPIRNYEHLALYNNDVQGFWLSPVNYLMLNETTVK